jgi:hypothetical protein
MNSFFETVLMTLVISAVLALPLWIVALVKGKRDTRRGFGIGLVAISLLFGLLSVSTEAQVNSCEASGGIGCADLYFVVAGGLFLFLGAWSIGTFITAIVLVARGTRRNEPDQNHLWCEQCVGFVLVDGHDSAHALRDFAAAAGQSNMPATMRGPSQGSHHGGPV